MKKFLLLSLCLSLVFVCSSEATFYQDIFTYFRSFSIPTGFCGFKTINRYADLKEYNQKIDELKEDLINHPELLEDILKQIRFLSAKRSSNMKYMIFWGGCTATLSLVFTLLCIKSWVHNFWPYHSGNNSGPEKAKRKKYKTILEEDIEKYTQDTGSSHLNCF